MKLDNDIKELMAFLYSRENMVRYEFSFDKRDNHFYARVFITETIYWTISFVASGLCNVREWSVTKSFYHPSPRVTYLNKYLHKYRDGYNNYCTAPISNVLHALEKIQPKLGGTQDRYNYRPWRSIRKATGMF